MKDEEEKIWCPFSKNNCLEERCALWTEGEIWDACAFRILAEQLVGGSIGIKTYADESISVD